MNHSTCVNKSCKKVSYVQMTVYLCGLVFGKKVVLFMPYFTKKIPEIFKSLEKFMIGTFRRGKTKIHDFTRFKLIIFNAKKITS